MNELTDWTFTPETIRFSTRDGCELTGDIFTYPSPKYTVLLSSGTGFPRRFYRHAAAHLAQKGAMVLTFDYRGIGDSVNEPLKRSTIDYPDWAIDMDAAVEVLHDRAPDLPLYHLAHSVGGHFIGLMKNHAMIEKHAFVSVGTGYFGGHHFGHRFLSMYFWWGLGQFSLLRNGYMKPMGGWSGEPLPPQVFKTWRRWSHRRSYFRPDLLPSGHYEAVTAPISSWVFDDDPIATPRSAQDILDCYPNSPREMRLRTASDYGLKKVGHVGAFLSGRAPIWDDVWQWLKK